MQSLKLQVFRFIAFLINPALFADVHHALGKFNGNVPDFLGEKKVDQQS